MKEHILIIEDEAAIAAVLEELLTEAGYKVTVAADGLAGMSAFQSRTFSLVLLDIMLPKIDGLTVCEMIRRESDVPVIMVTALDEEEAQVKAFELKADDYITKPFSLKLVLMRIEAVLRRVRKKKTGEILTAHGIMLDKTAREVKAKDKNVALTQTEFDLLETFMEEPGRVFTRDNLLNRVWGYTFIGDEKTVNIHIMNLRRKLQTDCITTIRGVGYRFEKEN